MDTKKYIETGILESFVLGQVSDQEQREVRCLRKIYPEIDAEIIDIETHLEKFAEAQQKTPPPVLKQNIMAAIKTEKQVPQMEAVTAQKPVEKAQPTPVAAPKKPRFNLGAAASIVLAIGLAGSLYFYVQNENAATEEINKIASERDATKAQLNDAQNALAAITAPEVIPVKLNGTDKFPDATAQVYWNSATGNVILNAQKLASAPSGKQYQLWVLVDGQPVDMGMVPLDGEGDLLNMKTTLEGQNFAITLENEGGSPTPDLENLVVIGTIGA